MEALWCSPTKYFVIVLSFFVFVMSADRLMVMRQEGRKCLCLPDFKQQSASCSSFCQLPAAQLHCITWFQVTLCTTFCISSLHKAHFIHSLCSIAAAIR